MSTFITHPTFYEGEILPAADLVASVNAARGQMARHERNLHTWGVASGLALQASSTPGGSPILTAGVASDGTGRELVLPSNTTLDPADFQSQVYPTNDPTTLYPVFLTGLDVPQASTSSLTGACNSSQPTVTQETCVISFGSPGDELDLNGQTGVGVADGPGDGVSTDAWKVLVGFVKWDQSNTAFSGVANYNDNTKIGVQYVGVVASQVESPSGTLLLETHPAGTSGALALQIKEDPSGGIVFGALNANGSITPTLTISAQGDITTSGQFRGAIATGNVQVESGLATNGTVLPLPSGVTQAQVDAGTAAVHAIVSLRPMGLLSNPNLVEVPIECYVDQSRIVHCLVRQFKFPGPTLLLPDQPAVCEYMVVAVVKSS
jgi:hypothetical protein